MSIVALVPAHNEEEVIGSAIEGLLSQTRPPDHIVVMADNCTDATAARAREYGVRVYETRGNTAKKAGALNQALRHLAPRASDDDLFFVQDADSIIDPSFLEVAEDTVERGYDAVGGVFRGGPGGGLVGFMQRNEYARYAWDVRRLAGKVLVLTGTATLFRASALKRVADARGTTLPGITGNIYDEDVLTEDNELTFAMKDLGMEFVNPEGATLETEIMPTWRALAKQRLRWKRGALENLRQYGFPRWSWPYWGRQVVSFFGAVVSFVYLATIGLGFVVGFHFQPVWLAMSLVFAFERVWTVRARGWRSMLFAAPLVLEMPFDVYLQGVQLRAVWQAVRHSKAEW